MSWFFWILFGAFLIRAGALLAYSAGASPPKFKDSTPVGSFFMCLFFVLLAAGVYYFGQQ